MSNAVTVRVPATSANLGPGFDAVGLAVSLFASITVTPDEPGKRRPPDPMRRMVTAAVRAAFRRAERSAPRSVEVEIDSAIPLGRGLGASAAARGAGIVAANALMGSPLSDEVMLEIGTELEGHADNVAPALFGGLQVTALDGSRVTRVDVPLPTGLKCVAFVPELSMPTHETRNLLPKRLSRSDSVFNSSRAALLIAALSTGSWEALNVATEERLHQRPRSALFPQMFEFFRAAREAGAHAAYLSGGGSTVMAFSNGSQADAVRAGLESAAQRLDVPGSSYLLDPCSTGAKVIKGVVG